jgi:hypothetical protein
VGQFEKMTQKISLGKYEERFDLRARYGHSGLPYGHGAIGATALSMTMLIPPGAKKDSALVMDFMGHLITGGVLFLLAGGVSMLIEYAADFADNFPKFWHLAVVFHAVSYLILILDVGCLVFFLIIRAYRFLRDTWNSRGA